MTMKVDRPSQERLLERAHAFVQRYPSPEDRAKSYIDIALNLVAVDHAVQVASTP